ncbi:MAG: esterase-like activity of phytase family protein [Candidatus Methylomirabilia bacterium]
MVRPEYSPSHRGRQLRELRSGDRPSKTIAALVVASCLLFPLPGVDGGALAGPGTAISVEVIPIELDPEAPGREELGALRFLSGFELRSADPRFGGLSGLELSVQGDSLYAVSDHGYWLSARLRHDATGRLTGLSAWEIAPLLAPAGGPLVSRRLRDAEALVRDRDGSFVVAFERAHRLWRYPPAPAALTSPPHSVATPDELAGAPANGGVEAVTVLRDGRLLALTEKYENPDGSLKGWLIENGRFASLSYLPSEGFRPTDLAALASGDVLLLERRYSLVGGPAARIRRLPRASLRAGTQLGGPEIARLELPLAVDNFEGLAVREDPEGGTLLYLISDDNYESYQRTLLLQFRLGARGEN